jgi:hypothetical protein
MNVSHAEVFSADLQATSVSPIHTIPIPQLTLIHSQGFLPNTTYSFAVGDPVFNCNPNDNLSIESTAGGSIFVGQSWSVNALVRWTIRGLEAAAGSGWSRSEAHTFSQETNITIQPGRMV